MNLTRIPNITYGSYHDMNINNNSKLMSDFSKYTRDRCRYLCSNLDHNLELFNQIRDN